MNCRRHLIAIDPVAGNAEAIVTGDKAMLMLKKYRHIRIIPLSAFLRKGE